MRTRRANDAKTSQFAIAHRDPRSQFAASDVCPSRTSGTVRPEGRHRRRSRSGSCRFRSPRRHLSLFGPTQDAPRDQSGDLHDADAACIGSDDERVALIVPLALSRSALMNCPACRRCARSGPRPACGSRGKSNTLIKTETAQRHRPSASSGGGQRDDEADAPVRGRYHESLAIGVTRMDRGRNTRPQCQNRADPAERCPSDERRG